LPCRVDLDTPAALHFADPDELAVANGHVGEDPGIALSVENATVSNDDVVRRVGPLSVNGSRNDQCGKRRVSDESLSHIKDQARAGFSGEVHRLGIPYKRPHRKSWRSLSTECRRQFLAVL